MWNGDYVCMMRKEGGQLERELAPVHPQTVGRYCDGEKPRAHWASKVPRVESRESREEQEGAGEEDEIGTYSYRE